MLLLLRCPCAATGPHHTASHTTPTMTIIDHSSIKRVSQDDGLESITLRSDLAARYTFLNETLLEGIGAVAVDNRFRTMLGLKEVVRDDAGQLITDETAYLRRWEQRLQTEVRQLEQTAANEPDAPHKAADTKDTLDTLLLDLDRPFPASSTTAPVDEDAVLAAFDADCAHVTAVLAARTDNSGR